MRAKLGFFDCEKAGKCNHGHNINCHYRFLIFLPSLSFSPLHSFFTLSFPNSENHFVSFAISFAVITRNVPRLCLKQSVVLGNLRINLSTR